MIEKLNKPRFRSRIVILDYDWTLVKPKSGNTFPKDVDDWVWLRPNVPNIVKDLYKKGYGIYVFTNQSKEWKKDQIISALSELDIPLTICIAYDKSDYKPSLNIYNEAFKDKTVKLDKSFLCGDAVGRANDHSDSDLLFAKAIGIKCVTPEDLFPFEKIEAPKFKLSKTPEVIIMVGYPGSGKDTFIADTFTGYFVANGDELKTSAKMIKAAKTPAENKQSIVFNATNPSKKKRAEYVEFAKAYALPVRCVHINTSMEESMARNNMREKPVPRIVYNVYKKNFELPDKNEGFEIVNI